MSNITLKQPDCYTDNYSTYSNETKTTNINQIEDYIFNNSKSIKLGSLIKYEVKVFDIHLLQRYNITIDEYCEYLKDRIGNRQRLYIQIVLRVNRVYDYMKKLYHKFLQNVLELD